jgi:putative ABC transport system permease protein
MLKNYLITSLRNLSRQKVFAMINLAGLSLGIAACLLIALYVKNELSYDRYHRHAGSIYKLNRKSITTGERSAVVPAIFYEHLQENIPGLENVIRIFNMEAVVSYNDRQFRFNDLVLTDPDVFEVFSWKMRKGNPAEALADDQSVVITATTAAMLFGDEDPVGKILKINNAWQVTVTGLLDDIPSNSHFSFSLMGNIRSARIFNPGMLTMWENASCKYYLKTAESLHPDTLSARLSDLFFANHSRPMKAKPSFELLPLTKVHLYSGGVTYDFPGQGNYRMVAGFAFVALLILLIACFNFMNLSTARAIWRARETGVRKVMGAWKSLIIRQFLTESILMAALGCLLALLIAELVLPFFNEITGKSLSLNVIDQPWLLLFIPLIIFLTGILAGIYPAIAMSRLQPVQVLKGAHGVSQVFSQSHRKMQFRIRQILVILQFSICAGLLIASIFVTRQMKFLLTDFPGFDREQVLVVLNPYNQTMGKRYDAFKEALQKYPEVVSVSGSHNIPARNLNNFTGAIKIQGSGKAEGAHMALVSVDFGFFETLGAKLINGRLFDPEMQTDKQACILNASAARLLELDQADGSQIEGFYDDLPRPVIGIIQDVRYQSLHQEATPCAYFVQRDGYPPHTLWIVAKIQTNSLSALLPRIEAEWKEIAPEWPFHYHFLDAAFEAQYKAEANASGIISAFGLLAMIVSSLGLFGLSLYMMATRYREIAIRKTIGASQSQVVRMYLGEFLGLVALANVLAWLPAWHFLRNWLAGFVRHIPISADAFIWVLAGTLLLSALTVLWQTLRATAISPARILGSE